MKNFKVKTDTYELRLIARKIAAAVGIPTYSALSPETSARDAADWGWTNFLSQNRYVQGCSSAGDIHGQAVTMEQWASELVRASQMPPPIPIPESDYSIQVTEDGVTVGCTSVDKATLQKVNVAVFGGEARP